MPKIVCHRCFFIINSLSAPDEEGETHEGALAVWRDVELAVAGAVPGEVVEVHFVVLAFDGDLFNGQRKLYRDFM